MVVDGVGSSIVNELDVAEDEDDVEAMSMSVVDVSDADEDDADGDGVGDGVVDGVVKLADSVDNDVSTGVGCDVMHDGEAAAHEQLADAEAVVQRRQFVSPVTCNVLCGRFVSILQVHLCLTIRRAFVSD